MINFSLEGEVFKSKPFSLCVRLRVCRLLKILHFQALVILREMIRGCLRGVPTRGIVLQLFQQVSDLLHLLIKFHLFFALTVRLGVGHMCLLLVLLVLSSDLMRAPLKV